MSEITETTARLHENSGRESYKVRQRLPRTSSVNKAKVYGRGRDHENIVESLLWDEIKSENGFSVVPIVGMPGVGKTTLAQHVYYDFRVQDHFDLQAWICVGEDFDALKVTKSILKSIDTDQPVDDNDLNLLQGKLKKKLSGKKFLLVLDDLWNDKYDHWNDLSRPFESCAPGNKVVITTRNMSVATMTATASTYLLNHLSDEDCLCILAEQSLGTTDFSKHQSLLEIGKKLAIKCYGLPLLAKAIGGLLRGKYSFSDWEDVLSSDMWNSSSDDGDGIIIPALRLCYHYLTPCLKKCFVSCSLFPSDYEFDEEELVSLWIAEGLLDHDDSNMQMEDSGREVFKELHSRLLFQQSNNDTSRFVMHGLIYDLALWAGQGLRWNNDTEPILGPSEGSSHRIDFREDNNIEDHKAQERSNRTVDLERIFVITNFIFELPSVVFDQLSSVHKPQYAFLSMLTSFASLFISIFGLVYKCTRENVIWKWTGALPWLYYPSPSDKLFGNFNDIVGLVCALCQCILSAITYGFVRRHADNPIKVSVWPLIFAFGLLCSNLFKKPEKRSSIS